MAEFLLAYSGGKTPEGEAAMEEVMQAWGAWMGSIGEDFVDMGTPLGASSSIAADGSVRDGGKSALSGYGIIRADSLEDAITAAKGCPMLADGGTVEVYEKQPM